MTPAPLRVAVQAATRRRVPARSTVRRWVLAAVSGHGRPAGGRVTVRFVDAAEGRRHNEAFRGKSGPTNVLAFPAVAAPVGAPGAGALELGDLVICLPVVAREARVQGKAPRAHLAHLVVHGTLHLLGHDHQQDAAARRMERLEVRVLAGLGLPDPYRPAAPPAAAGRPRKIAP